MDGTLDRVIYFTQYVRFNNFVDDASRSRSLPSGGWGGIHCSSIMEPNFLPSQLLKERRKFVGACINSYLNRTRVPASASCSPCPLWLHGSPNYFATPTTYITQTDRASRRCDPTPFFRESDPLTWNPKSIERVVGGASQLPFFRESDPLTWNPKILAEILHWALRNPQKLWRHPLNRQSPTLNARVRVPPLEWDAVHSDHCEEVVGDVIGWLRIDVLLGHYRFW